MGWRYFIIIRYQSTFWGDEWSALRLIWGVWSHVGEGSCCWVWEGNIDRKSGQYRTGQGGIKYLKIFGWWGESVWDKKDGWNERIFGIIGINKVKENYW